MENLFQILFIHMNPHHFYILWNNYEVVLVVLSDADKYMRSFGVSVSILTAIAVTYGVKYGMKKYDEDLRTHV